MSDSPTECLYCDHTDPDCGFCDMGKPLDTQEDWDASWGSLMEHAGWAYGSGPGTLAGDDDL